MSDVNLKQFLSLGAFCPQSKETILIGLKVRVVKIQIFYSAVSVCCCIGVVIPAASSHIRLKTFNEMEKSYSTACFSFSTLPFDSFRWYLASEMLRDSKRCKSFLSCQRKRGKTINGRDWFINHKTVRRNGQS